MTTIYELWRPIDGLVGKPKIGEIFDPLTDGVKIGDRIKCDHPNFGYGEFVALKGASGVELNDLVVYNQYTGTVEPATSASHANSGRSVAVATAANADNNKLSWYQIAGACLIHTTSAVVVNTPVYLTTQSGQVNDAVLAGAMISAARFCTTENPTISGIATNATTAVAHLEKSAIQTGASA